MSWSQSSPIQITIWQLIRRLMTRRTLGEEFMML
ncbi:transcription factor Dp-2 [Rhinolophus ferrumequinum]|uniref:Transcription factor Dp-2 n=1 Tax=Rhinolophus ferrumequinum TaxID=59479 RepID=A0A7J7UL29_RHIFE|nr:transcription factor Dp-2 [Rhinolophus ferrumequinum]